MSIVRVSHSKDNPYVMINKKSLWDLSLSDSAAILWARLLSRPDNWQISVEELSKTFKHSKSKIYSILKELIAHGYAYKHQEMPKGQKGFGKVEYFIFEEKMDEKDIQKFLTLHCFTDSVATPSAVKHPNKERSKQSSSKEDLKKNNNKAAAVSFEEQIINAFSEYRRERALKYYSFHKEKVDSRDNPIGWLIWAIENDMDCLDAGREEVAWKRFEWAKKNGYIANGGYMTVTDEGVEVGSGSTWNFYKYKVNHQFWKDKGL